MVMGTAFLNFAPWYVIDFWHRKNENLKIYRFFLVVDRIQRLWIEEIGEKKREDTGRKSLFGLLVHHFSNFKCILINNF